MALHIYSTNLPGSTNGSWRNVTGEPDILVCLALLQYSTDKSGGNTNADEIYTYNNTSTLALQQNIDAKRAILWLWRDASSIPVFTIVFHAKDAATGTSVTAPRVFVCAAYDDAMLEVNGASGLFVAAVNQFNSDNPSVPTDQIYLWCERGFPPGLGDPIYGLFTSVTTTYCKNGCAENLGPGRWPVLITSWQLNQGLAKNP
jgi:hypothetical protein